MVTVTLQVHDLVWALGLGGGEDGPLGAGSQPPFDEAVFDEGAVGPALHVDAVSKGALLDFHAVEGFVHAFAQDAAAFVKPEGVRPADPIDAAVAVGK